MSSLIKNLPLLPRGQVRDINSQTPRRRMVLFRGVCLFLPYFCYFSAKNLFFLIIYVIFATESVEPVS